MRQAILFVFICLLGTPTSSQNLNVTDEENALISKIKILRSSDLDSTKLYVDELKTIGVKLKKQNLVGLGYRLLADAYGNFGLTDSAILNYKQAEQIFIQAKDTLDLADCCNNFSGVLKENGNTNLAIEKGYKALNLYESLFKNHPLDSNYYFLKAYALNQIATVFMSSNQALKAIPLLKSSCQIHVLAGNETNAYRNYLNLAATYESLELLDSSLMFYQLAIPFFEKTEDIEATLVAYNNIGNLYDKKGNATLSRNYYSKALFLSEKNDSKRQVVQSLVNLSNLDLKNHLYDDCISKLMRAEKMAISIEALDFLKSIYYKLKTVYAFKNDFSQFSFYEDKYDSLNTVLLEQQSAKVLIEAEKKFETEKKDLQIKQQTSELELAATKSRQKNYFIYGGALVLGIVSLLGFLAYRNFIKVRKANSIIKIQNAKLGQSNIAITNQRNELELKNTEIMQSILYSKYLQTAILPKKEDIESISKINFIKYQPKDIVSGDYYWTHNTPNGLSIWATMDCTGHGVPGAMMSMLGISLLNEIVIEKHIYKPNEILNHMRERIIFALNQNTNLELKDGMDGSICVWDKKTNVLSYASANSAIWIYRDKQFIELEYDKMPIGKHLVMDAFENFEFQLQKGDWVTSMSDGLVDQFGGPENKKLKYKRVREFLNEKLSMANYEAILPDLQSFYQDWKGLNDQTDDVTVLGIKVD
jgi:serine phosphatase RsbU (regulator of sigma subunit)